MPKCKVINAEANKAIGILKEYYWTPNRNSKKDEFHKNSTLGTGCDTARKKSNRKNSTQCQLFIEKNIVFTESKYLK